MVKRLSLLIMVLGLSILTLNAVGFSEAFAGDETKTLTIGCFDPISIATGLEIQKTFNLIYDDINKSGGIVINGQRYNLKMIMYDDQTTTSGGKAAAERLVNQDRVKYVVGAMGGPAVPGGQTVTEPAGVLLFTGAAINQLIGPNTRYTYRGICYVSSIVKWDYALRKYPNMKKIVHVAHDHFLGRNEGDVLDVVAKGFGLKVIKHIYVPPDTQDFSSVAASAIAQNPDIIDTDGLAQNAGLFYKALYQAGWQGPKICEYMDPVSDLAAAGGPEPLENLICVFLDTTQLPDPSPIATNVRRLYEAKYNSWNVAGPQWVDPCYMFLAAIKKANSIDPGDIAEALSTGLSWDGFMGPYIMIKRPDLGTKRYCDALSTTYIAEVHNGKQVLADTISPEDGLKALATVLGHPGEWK